MSECTRFHYRVEAILAPTLAAKSCSQITDLTHASAQALVKDLTVDKLVQTVQQITREEHPQSAQADAWRSCLHKKLAMSCKAATDGVWVGRLSLQARLTGGIKMEMCVLVAISMGQCPVCGSVVQVALPACGSVQPGCCIRQVIMEAA